MYLSSLCSFDLFCPSCSLCRFITVNYFTLDLTKSADRESYGELLKDKILLTYQAGQDIQEQFDLVFQELEKLTDQHLVVLLIQTSDVFPRNIPFSVILQKYPKNTRFEFFMHFTSKQISKRQFVCY